MKLDERVNIGLFVGNNEVGFRAQWRPERAELFGIDIREKLAEWLNTLRPLSVEKLIDLSQINRVYFHVTIPRITNVDPIDEAEVILQKEFLATNEDYKKLWQQKQN